MDNAKSLALAFMLTLLTLACDLPFGAQEKFARYIEPTLGAGAIGANQASDATATADASTTLTANATPSPPNTSTARPPTTQRVTPAVYVVSLRVDPPQPRSGPGPITFFVRFQSTFATKQSIRWLVKIFRPGEVKSFGETAAITLDIPPGVSEIASANNWHTNPIQCEDFSARVYWVESGVSADPIEFKKPDGANAPFVEFKVCP